MEIVHGEPTNQHFSKKEKENEALRHLPTYLGTNQSNKLDTPQRNLRRKPPGLTQMSEWTFGGFLID